MPWQDDLRQLDEEFATGRIDPDEYRSRRESILAAATREQTGGQQQAQQGPFPPPFRWGPETPDSTQVMSAITDPPAEDRTTVVRPDQGGHDESADRTQVVPRQPYPAGPPSPPGGMPMAQPQQYQGQGWESTSSTPPWGGPNQLPPLAHGGMGAWARQGPEVFETAGKSNTGKIVGIVVAIVLVVVLGGGAAYLLINKSSDNPAPNAGGTSSTAPVTTSNPPSPTKPADPDQAAFESIPKPPGTQDDKSGVVALAKLSELTLASKNEFPVLESAGVVKVAYRASAKPAADAFPAMVFTMPSPAEATTLVNNLKAAQEKDGFITIDFEFPGIPRSVIFAKNDPQKPTVYRGLYAAGKQAVWITVKQDPFADESELSGAYQQFVKDLLKAFPASS